MIVIIDYGVGNIASVQRGFERAGIPTILSKDKDVIENAKVLILPGVGAFKDAMNQLENSGFIPLLKQHVQLNKPLIGICLGMQLLFESSSEFGFKEGLSFIKGNINYLDIPLKVPHMGWNDLTIKKETPIVSNVKTGDYVYFVHSYYAETDKQNIIATTNYGVDIPAIVQKDNVIGMQFHPEKSGEIGLQLLQSIKEMFL